MGYDLKGSLLEVCDCKVLCPCWIGEDPDNGTCQAALAYNFAKGSTIDKISVAGLTLASAAFLPGNVLAGNWKQILFIDDKANARQEAALTSVFKGERGGPIAELIKLVGTLVEVRRAPIEFTIKKGKGSFKVGRTIEATMAPYRGPDGKETVLVDSIFSTIPGSPAYVGKAERFRMKSPKLGIDLDIAGFNAIQGHFHFHA
jgi:hypothetical protein